MQKMVRVGHPFMKLAGISGAAAVILGAYGAHGMNNVIHISIVLSFNRFCLLIGFLKKDVSDEFKQVFETANKYHFLHSIAMMGVPLCRRPRLVSFSCTLFNCSIYEVKIQLKQKLVL